MNIALEDVNDNPPVFDRDVYSVSISEAVATGTEVLKVRATDKDSKDSVNSKIQYSLVIFGDDFRDDVSRCCGL